MKQFLNIIVIILFWKNVVAQEGVDCLGKAFHCVNSTHFLICVNLGNEMSITVDQMAVECPPQTACQIQNNFECELVPTTTMSAIPMTLKTMLTILPNVESTTVSASSTLNDSAHLWEATVINTDTITIPTENTTSKTVTAEKEALTDSKNTITLPSMDTKHTLRISSESYINSAQAKHATNTLSSRNDEYSSDSKTTKTASISSAAANYFSPESDGDKTTFPSITEIVSSTSMPVETKINLSYLAADSNTALNSTSVISDEREKAQSTVMSDITTNSSSTRDSVKTTVHNATEMGSSTIISTLTKNKRLDLPEDHNNYFNATTIKPSVTEAVQTTVLIYDRTTNSLYTRDSVQTKANNVTETGRGTTTSATAKSNHSNLPEDHNASFNAKDLFTNATEPAETTIKSDTTKKYSFTSDNFNTIVHNFTEIGIITTISTVRKSNLSNLPENGYFNASAIIPKVTDTAQSTDRFAITTKYSNTSDDIENAVNNVREISSSPIKSTLTTSNHSNLPEDHTIALISTAVIPRVTKTAQTTVLMSDRTTNTSYTRDSVHTTVHNVTETGSGTKTSATTKNSHSNLPDDHNASFSEMAIMPNTTETAETTIMSDITKNYSYKSDGFQAIVHNVTDIGSGTTIYTLTKSGHSNLLKDQNSSLNVSAIIPSVTDTVQTTVLMSDRIINSSCTTDIVETTVHNLTETGSGTTITSSEKSYHSNFPEDHDASFNATAIIPNVTEIAETTIMSDITKKYSHTSDGFQAIFHNLTKIESSTTNSAVTKRFFSNLTEDSSFNATAIIPNIIETTQSAVISDITTNYSNTSDDVKNTVNDISEMGSSPTMSILTKSSHSELPEDHTSNLNFTSIIPRVTLDSTAQNKVMSEIQNKTKTDSNSIFVSLSSFEHFSVTPSASTSNAKSTTTLIGHSTEVPSIDPTTYNTLNAPKNTAEVTNHEKRVNNFTTTHANIINIKNKVTSPLISISKGNSSAVPDKTNANYSTSTQKYSTNEFQRASMVTRTGNYGSIIYDSSATLEDLLSQKSTLAPNVITTYSKITKTHETTAHILHSPSSQSIELSLGNTATLSENSTTTTNTFNKTQFSITRNPASNGTLNSTKSTKHESSPNNNETKEIMTTPIYLEFVNEISDLTTKSILIDHATSPADTFTANSTSTTTSTPGIKNVAESYYDSNSDYLRTKTENTTVIYASDNLPNSEKMKINSSNDLGMFENTSENGYLTLTNYTNPTETSTPKYTIPVFAENSKNSTTAERSFQKTSFQEITTSPIPNSAYFMSLNITLESKSIFTLNGTGNADNLTENTTPLTPSIIDGMMNFGYNTLNSTVYLESSTNNAVESGTQQIKSTTVKQFSIVEDINEIIDSEASNYAPVNQKTIQSSVTKENQEFAEKTPIISDRRLKYNTILSTTTATENAIHPNFKTLPLSQTLNHKENNNTITIESILIPKNYMTTKSLYPQSTMSTIKQNSKFNVERLHLPVNGASVNNSSGAEITLSSTKSPETQSRNNGAVHIETSAVTLAMPSLENFVDSEDNKTLTFKPKDSRMSSYNATASTPPSTISNINITGAMAESNRGTEIPPTTLKSTTGSTHQLINYASDSTSTPAYIVKKMEENADITSPITSTVSVSAESSSVTFKASSIKYTTTPIFPESEIQRTLASSSLPKISTSTSNVEGTPTPTEHYLHQVGSGIPEVIENKQSSEKEKNSTAYNSTSGSEQSAYHTLVNNSAKSTTKSSLIETENRPVISTQYYHSSEYAFATDNSFIQNTKSTSSNDNNKVEIHDMVTSELIISKSLDSTDYQTTPSAHVTENLKFNDILKSTVSVTDTVNSGHLITNALDLMDHQPFTTHAITKSITENNISLITSSVTENYVSTTGKYKSNVIENETLANILSEPSISPNLNQNIVTPSVKTNSILNSSDQSTISTPPTKILDENGISDSLVISSSKYSERESQSEIRPVTDKYYSSNSDNLSTLSSKSHNIFTTKFGINKAELKATTIYPTKISSPGPVQNKTVTTGRSSISFTSPIISSVNVIKYDLPPEKNLQSITANYVLSALNSTVPINPIIKNTSTTKSSTTKIISSIEGNPLNANHIETATTEYFKSPSMPSIADKFTQPEYRRIESIGVVSSESPMYAFSKTVKSPVIENKLSDNIYTPSLDSISSVTSDRYSQSLNDLKSTKALPQAFKKFKVASTDNSERTNSESTSEVAQVSTTAMQPKNTFRSDEVMRNENLNSAETSNTSVTEVNDMLGELNFTCNGKARGRYADYQNTKKFYVCVGIPNPIVGFCPLDAIYISSQSKCYKTATVCEQFHCSKEGRFKDLCSNDSYYICQLNASGALVRYKLKCQTGYCVSASVKCEFICQSLKTSQKLSNTTNDSNDQTNTTKATVAVTCSGNEVYNVSTNKCYNLGNSCVQFHCTEAGRYKDQCSSDSYYICVKNSSGVLVRYKLKCQLGYEVNSTTVQCIPMVHPSVTTNNLLNKTNIPKMKIKEKIFDQNVSKSTKTNTTYYVNTEESKKYKDKKSREVLNYTNKDKAINLKSNKHVEKKIQDIIRRVESKKNKDNSKESSEEKYDNSGKKKQIKREIKSSDSEEKRVFICELEGVYPNPQNYKKYFECTYNKKRHQFRKRGKSCKNREMFDVKEKKCVNNKNVSKESKSVES